MYDFVLLVLFMTEYYQKHLEEVPSIGTDEKARLFAMFIRDPRFGLGRRDLGRTLLKNTRCRHSQSTLCFQKSDQVLPYLCRFYCC